MRPVGQLRPEFVQFIPNSLDDGILYISRRYRTASHLCCCGCGLEVVTPLNPAKWYLSEHADGSVSLTPSVGNWSFPCKSHYIVAHSRVQWAGTMSPRQIAAVQARDRHSVDSLAAASRPGVKTFAETARAAWGQVLTAVKGWLSRLSA
jgi:hypothetical protein